VTGTPDLRQLPRVAGSGNDRPYAGRSARHLERSARHVDHALVHVQDRVGRRHPEDAIPCPAPQWHAVTAAEPGPLTADHGKPPCCRKTSTLWAHWCVTPVTRCRVGRAW